MCLPYSSCGAEHAFLALNLIKNKQRNRLLIPTCDGLIAAKTLLDGQECYERIPTDDVLYPTDEHSSDDATYQNDIADDLIFL